MISISFLIGIVLFLFFVWYVYFTRSRARMRHEVTELLSQYLPLTEREDEENAAWAMHPAPASAAATARGLSPPRSPLRLGLGAAPRGTAPVHRDVEMEEFGLISAEDAVAAMTARPNPLAVSSSSSGGGLGPGLRSSLDALGLGALPPSSAGMGMGGGASSHYYSAQQPQRQQQQPHHHNQQPSWSYSAAPSAPPLPPPHDWTTSRGTNSGTNSGSSSHRWGTTGVGAAVGGASVGYTFVVTPPLTL
jgi:cbb3-type cytochrome oxidase subunit 3